MCEGGPAGVQQSSRGRKELNSRAQKSNTRRENEDVGSLKRGFDPACAHCFLPRFFFSLFFLSFFFLIVVCFAVVCFAQSARSSSVVRKSHGNGARMLFSVFLARREDVLYSSICSPGI